MSDFYIEMLREDEISVIHELLVQCGRHMFEAMGLRHWHPFKELAEFKNYIEGNRVYAVSNAQSRIGTFNLSTRPRDYYRLSMWENPNDDAFYC